MRVVVIALLAACDEAHPDDEKAFVVVSKLDGYERHVAIDGAGHAAFAAGDTPDDFVVTMRERNSPGGPDAVFVRAYASGSWFSSSPSPGVIVDDTPRIEPACDGCHADNAEALGMFTLPAVREAAVRGAVAHVDCAAPGTTPCEPEIYRTLVFE